MGQTVAAGYTGKGETMELTIYEIAKKLIGPVLPTGDHGADMQRLENLKELTALVDTLMGDISTAAGFASRSEASMKAIGKHAKEFIKEIQMA